MTTPLENVELKLKEWVHTNLPAFLNAVSETYADGENRWEMPIVEDYCLVVAVRDFSDGGGNVFIFADKDTASYRVKGLLAEALG